jgi:hypothetical protein
VIPEKNPAAEIKATNPDSGVEATDDPIPHKGKYSFLKSKIKTVHPDIKPKE